METICKLRIRDVVAEDEVTDDHLELYLKKLLKPKDAVYDIDNVGEESTYDLAIPDGDVRLMKLFMDFDEIIKKHALGDEFNGTEGRKLKSKLLIATLKPEAVRAMATTALKFKFREARQNDRDFFDLLLRIVNNQEEIHRASKPRADKRKVQVHEARNPVERRFGTRPQKEQTPKDDGKPKTRRRDSRPEHCCLKCKGSHWLADCPQKPTKEEYDRLIAEFRNKRILNQCRVNRIKKTEDDAILGRFGKGLPFPIELDSGADQTYIPTRLFELMAGADESLRIVRRPIEVQMAAVGARFDGKSASVSGYIEAPITIETSVENISLPNVKCWVMDAEMVTALIGRPELVKLGIDP